MSKPHTSPGLWALAWRRLRGDKIAMVSLAVVGAFFLLVLASAGGLVGANWEDEVAVSYAPPTFAGADPVAAGIDGAIPVTDERSLPTPVNVLDPLAGDIAELRAQMGSNPSAGVEMYGVTDPLADDITALRGSMGKTKKVIAHKATTLPFGADKWGHDVLQKTIKGGETSIVVGLVAALLAVVLGTIFGAVSGYFGGLVDDFFNWFYSIFTSIPSILMILTVAAVLQQKGVLTIVLILGLTGWTGPYRLIRAEYIKHKAREYVMAADAIGASHWRKMFSHIFPNVSHVALVQMSILVVGFIKAEVILSFLGFGVPVGTVSWGSMLNEAQNELILGKWWQLTAAATAMAVLVTAFSLFTDALRDALDPKVK
ncbi:ABC transporter permease [Janthinobacterium psychrotolerans]|uniref:Peptide/nickel transport system permease protein n=1 Tax=Janthinobacterium psychrotolerans TaxID=1747903 RepID=A0A1A7C2M3_9BURK|nr:ABC transporter permease [Janthinobacterium psychrotolerans]OBV39982.1 peptide/nickel transport system permease protein [Janthinobacterium psychrotolerans]